MSILHRYLMRQFLKPFIYSIFIFTSIILVSELFEKLDTFMRYNASILVALQYLIYRLPYWLVQIMPIAILLAVLFSLGNLSRNNEITAMKAAGINLYYITLPFLVFSIFMTLLSFYLHSSIAPTMFSKADQIYKTNIRKRQYSNETYNLIFAGQQRRKYNISLYNNKDKEMKNVSIDRFNENYALQTQIYAKSAKYEKDKWIFYDGFIRNFDDTGRQMLNEEYFSKKHISLPEKPDDFNHEQKKMESMNAKELKNYIKKLEKTGIPAYKELVNLYLKLAFPFSNIIMVFLGVPFAIINPRSGKIMGFSISIFTSFIYWGLMSFGEALGGNKILSPLLSAWLANIIFLLLGIILLYKIKK